MFTTCDEAVEWISHRRNQNKGLDHFKQYLKEYNADVDQLRTIHVAGTNGKGSTCNFLADCLMEAGYRVGTFTSPHLIKHQDRICINHGWIDDESFLQLCLRYHSLWQAHDLNMFEIDFDIMCRYFVAQKVDYAIVEVGLGGRLDATNSIQSPCASVIVSIGLDHMDRLGDTKEKIAKEKAGIIKPHCLIINGEKEKGPKEVIQEVAADKNAIYVELEEPERLSISPLSFRYKEVEYQLNTMATYQIHNASCAIETLQQMQQRGLVQIDCAAIQRGISKSLWRGRFETVSQNPRVIVDGAHNEHGVGALIDSLKYCPRPIVLVFAALKDKDFKAMIQRLNQNVDEMIITEFDFYRAATTETLNEEAKLIAMKDWREAIQFAESKVKNEGTVIITGSLYFISDVVSYYQKH